MRVPNSIIHLMRSSIGAAGLVVAVGCPGGSASSPPEPATPAIQPANVTQSAEPSLAKPEPASEPQLAPQPIEPADKLPVLQPPPALEPGEPLVVDPEPVAGEPTEIGPGELLNCDPAEVGDPCPACGRG